MSLHGLIQTTTYTHINITKNKTKQVLSSQGFILCLHGSLLSPSLSIFYFSVWVLSSQSSVSTLLLRSCLSYMPKNLDAFSVQNTVSIFGWCALSQHIFLLSHDITCGPTYLQRATFQATGSPATSISRAQNALLVWGAASFSRPCYCLFLCHISLLGLSFFCWKFSTVNPCPT